MKFFYMHPDDAQWLRRWLRNNLVCFLAILGFLLIIRFEGIDPLEAMKTARADHSEVATSSQLPAEREFAQLTSRSPDPIAPQGWRRTEQGWEDVSKWPPLPRPLGEIILGQQEREPAWIQFSLATVRGIPPLAFAMLQIAAIAVVVNLSRRRRKLT
jgi:hypothetical protein